ncbi:uncharacterized transmembrane protein DDB_G0289901 [Cephus cinctus]|uniref:Uncharacterized transmembrane protein DDB_G0289901 n=1 Tax=Cephus cinctus TaxID=211228 RepID=A0AAJ7BJ67_CEPCN|nr:uncharacterized transmembrane protein DDB_G0289901 [Cephus cinctus]
MRGSTIVLLGAVTLAVCVNAHPYSKIPDSILQSDGYHYKKSSSNSNSNSYSQSNEDNAEINGVLGGHGFSGSKTSGYSTTGGSHSQGNSYASGSFSGTVPLGLIGGSAGASAGSIAGSFAGSSDGADASQVGYGALGNPGTGNLGLSENGANFGYQGSHAGGSGVKGGLSGSGFSSGSGAAGNSGGQSSGTRFGASGAQGQPGIGSVASNSGSSGFGGASTYGQSGVSGSFGQSGSSQGTLQYWWNGPDSPFGRDGKPYGGCSSNACSSSGHFDLSKGNGGAFASNQGGHVAVNVQGNPFLSKGSGSGGNAAHGPSGSFDASSSFGSSGSQGISGSSGSAGASIGSGTYGSSGAAPIDAAKNPFLSGSVSSVSFGQGSQPGAGSFAGSSASSSASSGSLPSVGTRNPFLKPGSGQVPQVPQQPSAGPGQFSSQQPIGGSSSSQIPQVPVISSGSHQFGSQGPISVGSSNPFLNPSSGQAPQVPQQPSAGPGQIDSQQPIGGSSSSHVPQVPSIPTGSNQFGSQGPIAVGSSNPFLKPGSGSSVLVPAQGSLPVGTPSQGPGQIPAFPSQSTGGPGSLPKTPEQNLEQPIEPENSLTISCSGAGRICVTHKLCVNGKVNTNGQGLMQVRTGVQQCIVGREVCCTLEGYSGAPTQVGLVQGVDFPSSSNAESSAGSFASTSSFGSANSGSDQSQSKLDQFGQFGSQSGLHPLGSNVDQSKSGFNSAQSGSQSTVSTSFGTRAGANSQGGSGFIHVAPTGSPTLITATGSPDSGLIHVTPSSGGLFDSKSTFGSGSSSGGSSFGSGSFASSNANAGASAGSKPSSSGGLFDNQVKQHGGPLDSKPAAGSGSSQGGSSFGSGSFASSNANAGASAGSRPSSSGGLFDNQNKQSGGLFGSSFENSQEDLNGGDGNNFGVKSSGSAENNGYLPPIGDSSSNDVPAISLPPHEGHPSDAVPDIRPPPTKQVPITPAPSFPPIQESPFQVGCAAALICVEEQFCTLEGVISPEPVALTSQQLQRRVPLSNCKNPDNGVIGKCCRDPNYVDPWPTGNLPADYSGGFDEQGFPKILNLTKTPSKRPPPTKTSQPGKTIEISPSFNVPQRLPTLPPQISNIPGQIADTISNILPNNPFQKPSEKPGIPVEAPEDSLNPGIPNSPPESLPEIPNKPPGIFSNLPSFPNLPNLNLPSFPNFPNPFGGKNYDSASSNQNPTIIKPHTPGSQCGLKNKVQRPSGLSDVDVAFGEIPWQAMILSTRDRKLLCSGAIVTPNAILTAAHCVDGLQPSEVSIKSGEWKLGYELKNEEPLPFEIVKVSSIAVHPGYYPGAPSYDLAVLFLEHPVTLDQHVDTICLGNSPQPVPGRKCIATGWGKTVLQINVAGALMHGIDVDVLTPEECSQRLQGAESLLDIDETLVCVKAQKQGNNMCQVDVGGPLACDRGDGYYELTGVYSQDTGCLPTNQVTTYALIDTDWVKKTLNSPQQPTNFISPEGKSQSPVHTHSPPGFGSQVKQQPCDCQKSNLPPEINQYLPPL